MTASREITRTSLDDLTSVRVDCGLVPDDPAIAAELARVVDKLEARIGTSPTVDLALRAYAWSAVTPVARMLRHLRIDLRAAPAMKSWQWGRGDVTTQPRRMWLTVAMTEVVDGAARWWNVRASDAGIAAAARWYLDGEWRAPGAQ